MKKILLMSALTLCLSALTGIANAATCEMDSCATTIAGDSGHTSKKCNVAIGSCACTLASMNCPAYKAAASFDCADNGWDYGGLLIGGSQICCLDTSSPQCHIKKNLNPAVTVEASTGSESLSEAFDTNMDGRTNIYYGYVDTTLRSPSGGRTSDPMAKLDACLFHTDVTAIDNYVGNSDDKHHQCVGASMGCGTTLKNEYCQASGTNDGATVSAAVCKDRCDCIYPGAEGSVCGGN
jgi:hypothetical protein